MIDPAVLESLVTYVIHISGEAANTKDFSVFNDFLDETPTFRSYLLQLVLRHDLDSGLKLLEHYLEQTEHVLRAHSTARDSERVLAELHDVVVRCIEQTYWSRALDLQRNHQHPLELASRLLLETHETLGAVASRASRLYSFAKIRYSFETFTDFLYTQLFTAGRNGEFFAIVNLKSTYSYSKFYNTYLFVF